MKINKSKLRQIVKEELENVISKDVEVIDNVQWEFLDKLQELLLGDSYVREGILGETSRSTDYLDDFFENLGTDYYDEDDTLPNQATVEFLQSLIPKYRMLYDAASSIHDEIKKYKPTVNRKKPSYSDKPNKDGIYTGADTSTLGRKTGAARLSENKDLKGC